jgi:hypothetical protein
MNQRTGRIVVVAIAAANTATPVVGASMSRQALLFTGPPTGFYTLSNESSNVTPGSGLNVFASAAPLELTREKHGDVVSKAWYAVAGAATTVAVVETVLAE